MFTSSEEMDIRSFINASMECRGLPGMTTMVVKGKYASRNDVGLSTLHTYPMKVFLYG